MRPVRILGTGAHLPGAPITNDEIERLVGPLPKDILDGVQVQRRHWMIDAATGRHREGNTQMAEAATRQALARAGLEPGDVDLLVVSTASPEYPLPPMVTFLQDRLGLARCATIEIRSGCAGAVEALDVAGMYLATGRHRTAVVVGSEAISPLLVPLYLGRDPEAVRLRDRIAAYTFGDGAGAVVLQAGDDDGEPTGLEAGAIGSVGGGKRPGMQIIGAGTDVPLADQLLRRRLVDLRIDVVESARFTPQVIVAALDDILDRAAVDPADVDLCIIPEGNAGYLREELAEQGITAPRWEALEGKVFENLALVGATGSAAVPLALDHAWVAGRLSPGDRVLLLAIETSKWKYAGSLLRWTAGPLDPGRAG